MSRRALSSCAAALAVCTGSLAAAAEEFVVLDATGTQITVVDTDTGSIGLTRPLLAIDGDRILALERSPHDGKIYALGRKRLYRLDVSTATLRPAGPPFGYSGPSGPLGVGFDALGETGVGRMLEYDRRPGVNQPIDATEAFDVDLMTGGPPMKQAIDRGDGVRRAAVYRYVPGDPGEGVPAALRDLASTTGSAGAFSWTRFAVDANRHTLVRLGAVGGLAAGGDDEYAVTTIGNLAGLREDATPDGFEIAPDGSAYLLATVPFHALDFEVDLPDGGVIVLPAPLPALSGIYRVDLATSASERVLDLATRSFTDLTLRSDVRVEPARRMSVTKAAMRFDFRVAARDRTRIEGTLPFDATDIAGRTLAVVVGSDVIQFTLDAKGRGKSGLHRVRDQIRVDTRSSPPTFVLTLRGDTSLHAIVENPIGPASDGEFPAALESYFGGVPATVSIDLSYRRRGRVGSATLAP